MKHGRPNRKQSKILKRRIQQMNQEGKDPTEIAEELGLQRRSVLKHLAKIEKQERRSPEDDLNSELASIRQSINRELEKPDIDSLAVSRLWATYERIQDQISVNTTVQGSSTKPKNYFPSYPKDIGAWGTRKLEDAFLNVLQEVHEKHLLRSHKEEDLNGS